MILKAKRMARVGEEYPLQCPGCGAGIRLREDGRQEPAHFEPEVRKRVKACCAVAKQPSVPRRAQSHVMVAEVPSAGLSFPYPSFSGR